MSRAGVRHSPDHDVRHACGWRVALYPRAVYMGLSYMQVQWNEHATHDDGGECREIEPLLMEHDRGKLIELEHTL